MYAFLVDDDASTSRVVDGAADDLLDFDVVRVDAFLVGNALDCLNDEFGKVVFRVLRALPVIAVRRSFEVLRVVGIDFDGVVFETSFAFSAACRYPVRGSWRR